MKNKMTKKSFKLAYTDSMTEVQNRNAYEEHLKKLRKPNANISRITVIVVDVNGLKEINDSYGHFSGDDAIKTVAKALRALPNFRPKGDHNFPRAVSHRLQVFLQCFAVFQYQDFVLMPAYNLF